MTALDILSAVIFTFIIGSIILSKYFSLTFCVIALGLKLAIPVGYFVFVDNKWLPYDGLKFQQYASELLGMGYTPLSIFFHWDAFVEYVDSTHVMPYWWNMLGQSLFGQHYYATVFLNIIATIIIGLYVVFILSRTGFSEQYYTYFFAFFLFQWEILTWSSLINIKGVFTTLLIVMYIYHVIMAISEHKIRQKLFHIFIGGVVLYLLYWTRFYIVFILIVSSIGWIILETDYKKVFILGILGSLPLYLIGHRGLEVAKKYGHLEQFDISSFIEGTLRVLLTPRPWAVLPEFSFLIPSSILHWLFFLPSMLYSLHLGYQHRNLRFLLVYLVIFTLFYGTFSNLASARMRFQIVFILAIFQFHFLWSIARSVQFKSEGAKSHG